MNVTDQISRLAASFLNSSFRACRSIWAAILEYWIYDSPNSRQTVAIQISIFFFVNSERMAKSINYFVVMSQILYRPFMITFLLKIISKLRSLFYDFFIKKELCSPNSSQLLFLAVLLL